MNLIQGIGKNLPNRYLSCILLVVASALLLQSCKKEYFDLDRLDSDVTWNPELAVPLIESEINMEEALERFDDEDIIIWDNQGLLALKYFSNIFSFSAENAFSVQDQSTTFPTAVTPADVATVTGGNNSSNTLPATNYPLDLSLFDNNPSTPNSPTLETVDFKGGNMNISASSSINCDARVDITMNNLRQGGTPLTISMVVPANGSQGATAPIANHRLDMVANPNNLSISATITYIAGTGTPIAGQPMNITVGLSGLQFRLITGDFREQNVPVPLDSVRIRLFNNSPDGDIVWEDPELRALFTNTFGTDIHIGSSTFFALNQRQNTTVNLIADLTGPAGEEIRGNGSVYGVASDTVLLNSANSNVKDIAEIEPNFIVYNVDATVDPASSTLANNWVADTSKLRMDLEAYLPFFGTASDFKKVDTTEIDIFPIGDDIEEITSVMLRLILENGFPIDGYGQVVFMDSSFNRIDSVWADPRTQILASGVVVNEVVDQVSGRTRTITDITISRELLEKLEAQGLANIELSGWAETTTVGSMQTPVKIFQNYSLKLNLALKVEAKVKATL